MIILGIIVGAGVVDLEVPPPVQDVELTRLGMHTPVTRARNSTTAIAGSDRPSRGRSQTLMAWPGQPLPLSAGMLSTQLSGEDGTRAERRAQYGPNLEA
jgi:hypothetical protein